MFQQRVTRQQQLRSFLDVGVVNNCEYIIEHELRKQSVEIYEDCCQEKCNFHLIRMSSKLEEDSNWRYRLLARLEAQKESILEQIDNLERFNSTVEQLGKFGEEGQTTEVGLKSDVSISAKLQNPKEIFVNVGFGIYIACGSEEALKLVQRRIEYLQNSLERILSQIGKARANEDCVRGILDLLLEFDASINTHA